jgi:ribosomal protein L24E
MLIFLPQKSQKLFVKTLENKNPKNIKFTKEEKSKIFKN